MDTWTEIRTAAAVARLGTVSAAADALGVHRATVNRHVDTLEATLGAKLFQRHARGFAPTELGRDLLRIADATDEQIGQLQRRAHGASEALSGEFVITTLESLEPSMLPLLKAFRTRHPGVRVRVFSTNAVLKLQYGEAHVALRAGAKPTDPDNVVRPYSQIRMALYASREYATRYGIPKGPEDYGNHSFIGPDRPVAHVPFLNWMAENVPPENITFACNTLSVHIDAVLNGNGIGFLPNYIFEERSDLVEVLPPCPEWESTTWLVTHVDLHRTAKVQAFLAVLKEQQR